MHDLCSFQYVLLSFTPSLLFFIIHLRINAHVSACVREYVCIMPNVGSNFCCTRVIKSSRNLFRIFSSMISFELIQVMFSASILGKEFADFPRAQGSRCVLLYPVTITGSSAFEQKLLLRKENKNTETAVCSRPIPYFLR